MIEVICSGFGGQGVLVAGMILADAGMRTTSRSPGTLPMALRCAAVPPTVT
ncbi:MAG: hypothetical protein ACLUNZ_03615 [Evtepia sp.]